MPSNPSQAHEPGTSQRKIVLSWLLGLLLLAGVLVVGAAYIFFGASFADKPSVNSTPTADARHPIRATATTPLVGTVMPPTVPTSGVAYPTSDPQLPLAGRRIGLDPGHGPRDDLGAVYIDPNTGKIALSEAEVNLDVALRCRDLLVARGADVVLTRETADTFITPWPVDSNGDGIVGASGDELQSRIDIVNSFHAEIFLSIHANSSSEPGNGDDLQVLYCGAADCAFPADSKRLGRAVLAHLTARLSDVGYLVRGGSTIDDLTIDNTGLHMFLLGPASPPRHPRATTMPGVIGETLYVTLPSGAELLLRDDVRQAIALGYADALQQFLIGSN